MTSDTATAILRLFGVLTIFIGLVLFTQVGIQLVAASAVTAGGPAVHWSGPLTALGLFGLLVTGSISLWGALLYRFSPALGKRIATQDR